MGTNEVTNTSYRCQSCGSDTTGDIAHCDVCEAEIDMDNLLNNQTLLTFSVETLVVGSRKEESRTLANWGIDVRDFMKGDEIDRAALEKEIDAIHKDWIADNIYANWSIEE